MQDYFSISKSLRKYLKFPYVSSFTMSAEEFKSTIWNLFREIHNNNEDKLYFLDRKYKFTGTIRLTQRRILLKEKVTSNSPLMTEEESAGEDKTLRLATDSIKYNDYYSDKYEENKQYESFVYDKDKSYKEKGGYVLEFDLKENIDENKYNSFFKDDNNQMTSMVIDMPIINIEMKYLINVVIIYQYSKVSLGTIYTYFNFLKRNYYNSSIGVVSGIFQGLFVLILIVYFLFIIHEINARGLFNQELHKTNSHIKLFFLELLNTKTQLIQMISFILSFTCLGMWVAVTVIKKKNMNSIKEVFKSDYYLTLEERNDIINISEIIEIYKIINGINLLILLTRLIKVISTYVYTIKMFMYTIRNSISMLFAFFVYFLCIVLGFAFFSWLYYGRYYSNFSTISKAFNENVAVGVGLLNKDLFGELYSTSPPICLIYFFVIGIIVKYVIVNILIAILIYYYKITYVEYEAKEKIKFIKMNENESNRSFIYKMILGYMYIWDKIFCCFKNVKGVILNEKKEEIKCEFSKKQINYDLGLKSDFNGIYIPYLGNTKQQIVEKMEIINAQFTDDYEYTLRDTYFDSAKDKTKIKLYFNTKYRKILIRSLIYIVFMVFILIISFFNIISSWSNNFNSMFKDNIMTKTGDYQQISNLDSLIFSEIPAYFAVINGETFLNDNILLGNSLIITFDTSQSENKAYSKDTYYYIDENNQKQYLYYDKFRSSDNEGGYCYIYNMLNPPISTIYNQIFPKLVTNKADIELILRNKEYQLGIYVKLHYSIDKGGNNYNEMMSYVIKYNDKQGQFDVIKYTFEGLSIAVIFIIIYFFISDNITKWKHYNKWYNEIIHPQNDKIKYIRNDIEIEILRQIKEVIFTLENIIDASIIVIFFVMFGYCIFLIVKEDLFESEILNNSINEMQSKILDLRQIVYLINKYRTIYTTLACILIFLICLRVVFEILKFSKYFKVIYLTLSLRARHLVSVIILIILIHPCFVLYTHITMGDNYYNYSTISNSIISLARAFFGYLKLGELTEFNFFVGVVLYYTYLIVINMILVNFFFCVIYSCYVFVKKSEMNPTEIWEWKGIFGMDRCLEGEKNENEEKNMNESKINEEFEFDKVMESYFTKIMKNKVEFKLSTSEWLQKESANIEEMDNLLEDMFNKRRFSILAFNASLGNLGEMFEDNPFNNMNIYQFHCFNVLFLKVMFLMKEKMRKDAKCIKEAIELLNNQQKDVDYDKLHTVLKDKSNQIRAKINEIDKSFIEVKDNLDNLYLIKNKKQIQEIENENENSKSITHNEIFNKNKINDSKPNEKDHDKSLIQKYVLINEDITKSFNDESSSSENEKKKKGKNKTEENNSKKNQKELIMKNKTTDKNDKSLSKIDKNDSFLSEEFDFDDDFEDSLDIGQKINK